MAKSDEAVRKAGALGVLAAGAAAALFLLATSLGESFPPVARFGGAGWVFILAWIITMPVLAPWLRRRSQV